jgi:hypothetical protein
MSSWGSFEDAESLRRWAFLRRTPAQRLDWLIEMLEIAYRTGAIKPRGRTLLNLDDPALKWHPELIFPRNSPCAGIPQCTISAEVDFWRVRPPTHWHRKSSAGLCPDFQAARQQLE